MKYEDNFQIAPTKEEIYNELVKEKENVGYYNLVFQDTSSFKEYAQKVTQQDIVVVGIGGSSLGTLAIYDFLKCSKKLSKRLFFLESTDPVDISSKLGMIDINNALFIIISKSGTTVETISIFKYLHNLTPIDKDNCLIITETDSGLDKYAQKHGMTRFEIPKNVGGRFSVFSAVGLLPLAIVGVDIDALLSGAQKIHNSFFEKKRYYQRLMEKAKFITSQKDRASVNVVFSYTSKLEGFNKWYVQLWGESLGKIDKSGTMQGMTPVGLIGPIDQHSFLQLIMEGRKDKTVTFIKVDDFASECRISDISLEGLEELDCLNGLTFNELINLQADSTIEAIREMKNIPFDVITIESINEKSIARLMYEYKLLTSICAKYLHIDAYDQPGVEAGKLILKEKLNKCKTLNCE